MFRRKKEKNEQIDLATVTRSSQLPDWHFIRLTNYNYRELDEIKNWLRENVLGNYKRIGWDVSCPYEVGVIFELDTDAMAYKLTWIDASGDLDYYSEDPLYEEEDDDDEEIWV